MSFDTRVYPKKYCEKHNQRYHEYLTQCPICRGEAMEFDQNRTNVTHDTTNNDNEDIDIFS